MNPFRIFLFVMALSLWMGLSSLSLAQDGQNLCSVPTLLEPIPPNILFLLDNSGSMLDFIREDDGTPTNQRRIDVLKEALNTMLEEAHHVNVGVARFASLFEEPETEPNVPILFPISDIEGFTHQIPGEPDDTIKKVAVSIAQSSDDAEEKQGTGKIFLSNPQLQVVQNGNPYFIGLRFEAIDIPQGAKIISAHLELVSGTSVSTPTELVITAENVDNAQPFTDERRNISSRTTTSEMVAWNTANSWQEGTTYTSPDITSLVQKIVNRTGWCGGNNGLAFKISANGEEPLRNITAYDDSPSMAPRLIVEYDSKEINGTGCINQNWSGQISASTDDAEERIVDHFVFLNSPVLELGQRSKDGSDPRLVGFRFNNVPLSKEAEIVKAHLILTSWNNGKDRPGGTLSISGEKSPNASSFMADNKNLSQRTQTSALVNWALNDTWQQYTRYQSPDISTVIQEIIQQPDWQAYNSLALFIQGNSRYDVASFDTGPSTAPLLHIQVKGLLGEGQQGELMTVRRRVKNIVQNMEIPLSKTPLVDGLYEAAQYYLGKPVDYGKDRHSQSEYLVSHPGTYTRGIIEGITDDCDINSNPYHDSCANERISGNPVYVSPITSNDQLHHIVLLTDGIPNINTASSKIPALLAQLGSQTDCATSYTVPNTGETQTVSSAETCGIELADALAKNNILVHVVALFMGKAWLSIYQDSETQQRIYKQDGIYFYEDDSEVPPERMSFIESMGYEENVTMTQHNEEALKFLCRLASKGNDSVGSVDWCRDRYFHTANTMEEISTRILPQIMEEPNLAQLNIATIGEGTVNIAFAPPIVEAGIVTPANLDDNVNCTVDCGTGCAETYMQSTATKLTATPASGFTFTGWSGDCNNSSTNPLMFITGQNNVDCTATFEVIPTHTLTMTTTGNGSVSGHGINCGTDCTESYTDGTIIKLTATPASDSSFAGWTGAGCADSFTITSDMACTANFLPIFVNETPIETEAEQIEELFTEISDLENEPLPSEEVSDFEQSDIVGPIQIIISHHETSTEVSTDEVVVGEPETTMPLNLTLVNHEAESDTFTILLTDSAGWIFGPLPTTIEIDGHSSVDFVLEVFLPKIGGETNTLTITVTSQTNPAKTITAEIQIATSNIVTEDNQIVTPQEEPEISEPITSENETIPTTPASPIVENKPNPIDTSDTMTDMAQITENPAISDNDLVETVTGDNQMIGDKENTANSDLEDTMIPEEPTNVVEVEEEERLPYNIVVIPPASIVQCPPTGLIDKHCKNHGQVATDVTLGSKASISGGEVAGSINNQGLISNVTIQKQTTVSGGQFSGYIVNKGTIANFEFVGAKITGGTLSGTIYNNSEIGGFFKDVQLAPNTHIIGGIIVGNITGDINAPALLENVKIRSGSHLVGVTLGNGVTLADNVTYGDGVQTVSGEQLSEKPTDSEELPSETNDSEELPSETNDSEELPILEPAIAVNANGEITNSEAQFSGGLSIAKGPFESSTTVTLSDEVDIRGHIEIATKHQRQVIESSVVIAYQPIKGSGIKKSEDGPVFFMLEENGELLPWDFELASLNTFQTVDTPTDVLEVPIYQGQLPATGLINIYFGYRLTNGTVVYSPQTLDVIVNGE